MAHILVTKKIPDVGLQKLTDAGHTLDVATTGASLSTEELIAKLGSTHYDGVVSLLTDTIDASVLAAAPTVKIVANYAVGYNNINVAAAAEQGVQVTNTPGVLTDSVAEFTLSLICSITKRVVEADMFTRAGNYHGWEPELLLGSDLAGKTLGVIGGGRIGTGVACRARHGFDMQIVYTDMQACPEIEEQAQARYIPELSELLQVADVVSVHVPLVESTRHLISGEQFEMMKSTAYLVNTSRGPVIDEAALVTALQQKTIRGAALDVFENEPALSEGLTDLPNVIMTPHIASATEETRNKMSEMVADNLIAHFNGETPPNLVG